MKHEKAQKTSIKIKSKFGNVTIKIVYKNGVIYDYYPEKQECIEIAKGFDLQYHEVYNEILSKFNKYLQSYNMLNLDN